MIDTLAVRVGRRVVVALLLLLATAGPAAAQFCIDLNTAPREDLEAIAHVGSERAGQIVELRQEQPFRAVEELTRVNGIAASRLVDIVAQGLACVGGAPVAPEPEPAPLPATSDPEQVCTLQRVVDGDTLVCGDGRTIRLLLVDTPEMDQRPFGPVARQMLQSLAPIGTPLLLEFDVQRLDPYRRVLAYVYLPDGRMVNEELLRLGTASVAVFPPNVRRVDQFRTIATAAREGGVGFWAVDGFACPPADHRAGRC